MTSTTGLTDKKDQKRNPGNFRNAILFPEFMLKTFVGKVSFIKRAFKREHQPTSDILQANENTDWLFLVKRPDPEITIRSMCMPVHCPNHLPKMIAERQSIEK
jgi:hypothetical protein